MKKVVLLALGLVALVFGQTFSLNGSGFHQKLSFDGSAFTLGGNTVLASNTGFVEGDVAFDSVRNRFIVGFTFHTPGGGVQIQDTLQYAVFDANGNLQLGPTNILTFAQDTSAKRRPRIGYDSTLDRMLIAYEYTRFDEPAPEIAVIHISLVNVSNGAILVPDTAISPFDTNSVQATHLTVVFNPNDNQYALTYFGATVCAFHRISNQGASIAVATFQKSGQFSQNPTLLHIASSNTYIIAAEVITGSTTEVFAAISDNVGNFNFDAATKISNGAVNSTAGDISVKLFGTSVSVVYSSASGASKSLEIRLINPTTLVVGLTKSVNAFIYDQIFTQTNSNTELGVVYRGSNTIQISAFDASLNQLDNKRLDPANSASNYQPTSPAFAINPATKDHFVIWSTSFPEGTPPPPPGVLTTGITVSVTTGSANSVVLSFGLIFAAVVALML